MSMPRMIPASVRCWVEIELDALRHNAAVARELAGRNSRVLAVVKADGYGLGAVEISRHLAEVAGGRDFAVKRIKDERLPNRGPAERIAGITRSHRQAAGVAIGRPCHASAQLR